MYIYIYMEVNNIYIYIYIYNRHISQVDRVFANGLGDLGSIPGRVIIKTLKMVLDTALLNTQEYKVRERERENGKERKGPTKMYTQFRKGNIFINTLIFNFFLYRFSLAYIYGNTESDNCSQRIIVNYLQQYSNIQTHDYFYIEIIT